jgi:hypothetical protein
VPSSFAPTMPTPTPALTPTPAFKPLIHSNPSTPRQEQPEAKRRRVTPENEQGLSQAPEAAHVAPSTEGGCCPWLNWQSLSPASSPEDELRKKRRRLNEQQRLERAGGSLKLYNAGRFGPRTGIDRL